MHRRRGTKFIPPLICKLEPLRVRLHLHARMPIRSHSRTLIPPCRGTRLNSLAFQPLVTHMWNDVTHLVQHGHWSLRGDGDRVEIQCLEVRCHEEGPGVLVLVVLRHHVDDGRASRQKYHVTCTISAVSGTK